LDVENLLARASDNLSVRRAFGAAYEKDGLLIIPVALVAGGGGGGTSGTRYHSPAAGPDPVTASDAAPQRTDSGGGFGGLVLPEGAYVVRGDQVRWVPAVSPTLVVLASLGLVRILAGAWVRRSRARSRRPNRGGRAA
jgi:uncharacterized spore protein YtfJ